ncbi:NAD-dependent aldehyde dehydrogenase [Bernardetia litoralis DSM 6794]|uniref:NAD-dependent aldehyde dehydrogenase n=1 Tax=Bernardetia litoralis (strain ATCC 23117 / DSM 6794 / NBRC 15988 / NCIMB 1366 / Fx l1 / Sio-4) TaxID=880071 RepID=I4AQT7_BERLS|nr:aldehyde dehydrogenase [Bernardetia litoralis]AFM06322.1 NAD-dependent aldehyde dehydrogenase [Bernardetia litoralis DSM 6794]
MKKLNNYIGGEFINPFSDNYIENINPATGKVFSLIADSDENDVNLAVEAAKVAFPEWSSKGAEYRSKWLLKLANYIEENVEKFAQAETQDNGKPISLSCTMDIPRAVQNLSFFATAILHDKDEAHHTSTNILNYTLRQPLGVVGCISPWNLPLYLFTWKIAPALASGNCVVAKPSELTPYTAYLLSEACQAINFPNGVLNIVHGYGHQAGAAITAHKDTKAISFTGGTQTGKTIASIAAPMFKKLSLELGGKNATIIFADSDLEEAIETAVKAAFTNQGQICLCGSRILIEKVIYEEFKIKFIEKVKELKVGDPLEKNTQQGATVSKAHQEKVLSYIEIAKNEGGIILTGGNKVASENLPNRCKDGFFIEPTVIEGLSPFCRTNQEEIFGAVTTLIPFENENEAIEFANCTPYGLSASVWTQNLSRAHRVASQLETGIVWINTWLLRDLRTPFGGAKQSGVGREGGYEALNFFTEEKNVCIKF